MVVVHRADDARQAEKTATRLQHAHLAHRRLAPEQRFAADQAAHPRWAVRALPDSRAACFSQMLRARLWSPGGSLRFDRRDRFVFVFVCSSACDATRAKVTARSIGQLGCERTHELCARRHAARSFGFLGINSDFWENESTCSRSQTRLIVRVPYLPRKRPHRARIYRTKCDVYYVVLLHTLQATLLDELWRGSARRRERVTHVSQYTNTCLFFGVKEIISMVDCEPSHKSHVPTTSLSPSHDTHSSTRN